jgi:hypothetical protein
VQSDQAGHLVLFALGLMHARSALARSSPQTPAIDLDDDYLRHDAHPRGQFPATLLDDLGVPLLRQFVANFVGDPLDLRATDFDPGQVECEGGLGGGVQLPHGLSDLLQDVGAEVVVVQTQRRPEGGKSPGGTGDSGRSARGVGGLVPCRA